MTPSVVRFSCTPDMAAHVSAVFGGEYEFKFPSFQTPPRVLDIGACFGEFARWARVVWEGCTVTCVEPNPKVQALLEKNLAVLTDGWRIVPKAAVSYAADVRVPLYAGPNNIGEASLRPDVNGAGVDGANVMVETIPIWELGACDVLKIDCEGNEPHLLATYLTMATRPAVVMLEYHSPEDKAEALWIGREFGYQVAKVQESDFQRGVIGLRGGWL